MPDLTLAIPVFNEEKHISRTITSALAAIDACLDLEVEVLVLDNASTDNTAERVSAFSQRPELQYLTNSQNEGFNFSIDRLAREARGRYIWFLGAQEVVEPGAIESLRDDIKEGSAVLLLLDFHIFDETIGCTSEKANYGYQRKRVWTSPFRFLLDVRGPALALSGNVVRRDNYLSAAATPLISRGWAHYERLLDCSLGVSAETPAVMVSTPCFVLYREADGWWTTEAVYTNFLEMMEVLQAKLKGHPLLHQMMFRRQSGRALLRSISAAKRNGLAFDKALIERSRKAFRWSPTFWVVGLPMMLASTHRPVRQG